MNMAKAGCICSVGQLDLYIYIYMCVYLNNSIKRSLFCYLPTDPCSFQQNAWDSTEVVEQDISHFSEIEITVS